jgi:hypothetical protein
MDGLLANEVVVVGEKPETAVVFGLCVGPDWPAPVCEHPATSTESVTRTAIRIPTG